MSEPVQKPSKHRVREYLYARQKEKTPPPTPEEIRHQLGWSMLPRSR